MSLEKFLILYRYLLLEAELRWFCYSLSLYIKQEIQHGVRSGIRTHAQIRGPETRNRNLGNIHHIEIKDNVTPKVTPVRKIPFEAEIRKGIKMYG